MDEFGMFISQGPIFQVDAPTMNSGLGEGPKLLPATRSTIGLRGHGQDELGAV